MFGCATNFDCSICKNFTQSSETKKPKCINYAGYIAEKRENSDFHVDGCRNYKVSDKEYRVSLGFRHWIYYDVKAGSREKALQKARNKCSKGEDYDGQAVDREEEFDEVEEIKD